MTEHDYLTSTDPRALWEAFGERMTERQIRFFDDALISHLGFNIPAFRHMDYICESTKQSICEYFRDILGNPFRHDAINALLGAIKDDWLTWQNGTIPKLAAACCTKPCGQCETVAHSEYGKKHGLAGCEGCSHCGSDGTYIGQVDITPATLDPFRLQVLADAVEEAGCSDEWVLNHLRSREKCLNCDGSGEVHSHNTKCWECSGKGTRPISHVVGCWAVELFLG